MPEGHFYCKILAKYGGYKTLKAIEDSGIDLEDAVAGLEKYGKKIVLAALKLELAEIVDDIPNYDKAFELIQKYGKGVVERAMRFTTIQEIVTETDQVLSVPDDQEVENLESETTISVYDPYELERYCELLSQHIDESVIRYAKVFGYTDVDDIYWAARSIHKFGFNRFRQLKTQKGESGLNVAPEDLYKILQAE